MNVWSCSMFMNELDVLEIRLAELYEQVNMFVLCEATSTHTGKPRELIFPQHKERYAQWEDKIRYIAIDFPDDLVTDWSREAYQREQLGLGLNGLQPEDIIIVADVDEILKAEVIHDARLGRVPLPATFSFPIHPYRLDWKWKTLRPQQCRCTLIRGDQLKQGEQGYGGIHYRLMESEAATSITGEYGWHFTYIGDEQRIIDKTNSIADEWVKGAATIEQAKVSISKGVDLFGREDRAAEHVDLSELPQYVQDHPERFAHILGLSAEQCGASSDTSATSRP